MSIHSFWFHCGLFRTHSNPDTNETLSKHAILTPTSCASQKIDSVLAECLVGVRIAVLISWDP